MTIVRAWVTEHEGKMAATVRTARSAWRQRRSLVLHLEDSTGALGRGEASPLPGYSTETLEECRRALDGLDWAAGTRSKSLPSAAQFAVDTAVLDLQSQSQARPTWNLLAQQVPPRIPLCKVLHTRDPQALRDDCAEATEHGYRCFKLKIGIDAASDLERCRTIRRLLPAVEIRLDANRAFARDEASRLLAPFRELGCAFVEEPWSDPKLVDDLADLVALVESSPLPVALDESLRHPGAPSAVRFVAERVPLGALVLKPMALGGIAVVRDFAVLGNDLGVPIVLSHLFDGPLAHAAAQALALAFGSPEVAAGLAPHDGLTAWTATNLPGGIGSWVTPWSSPGVLP